MTDHAGDPLLEPGARAGEYVVERLVGSGGFGTVYAGAHPVIGKRVAVKVLARKFSVDAEAVARFVNEARVANQIHHRSIVDVFAFGTLDDGRHYHVMEYLDGETLERLLERRGRLPPVEALPILRGVASALDAAHALGVVHRDLKPANVILVSDSGKPMPKIIDFGVAKLVNDDERSSATRSGALIGTPQYMSPEQCRGRDVGTATDAYALGVLAYELLTGQPPFTAPDSLELMLKHTATAPAPPSTLVPELGPAIDALVLSLLEKLPERRPTHLEAALDAFEASIGLGEARTERALQAVPGLVSPSRTPDLAAGKTLTTPDAAASRSPARSSRMLVAGLGAAAIAVLAGWTLLSRARVPEPVVAGPPPGSPAAVAHGTAAPAPSAVVTAPSIASVASSAPAVPKPRGAAKASRRAAPKTPGLDDDESPFESAP